MKSLKNLLEKNFPGEKNTRIDEKTIFFIFKEVIKKEFGEFGAEKFKADYFSGKTIFVKTQSSAWASELWANRERIIRKINEKTGSDLIEEIKIK